jgi:hypothetical protein
MEFLTQKPTPETVVIENPARYLVWQTDELRGLFARNLGLYFNIQALFSADLAKKLDDVEHSHILKERIDYNGSRSIFI